MIYLLRLLNSDGNFYLPEQSIKQSIADCLAEFNECDWFEPRFGPRGSPQHFTFIDGSGKNISEDVAELFIEKNDGDLDDLPKWVEHHAARACRMARDSQLEADIYGTQREQAYSYFVGSR